MKKTVRLSLLALPLLLSAFCATQKENDSFEIEEHLDLAYFAGANADAVKHKLNLFLPKGKINYPTVLWIHGGAWATGGREQETRIARQFAKRGIGFAAISYRLSPGTWMDPKLTEGIQHPEHARDCARAFKWLHENGSGYGIDADKLILSGYSAGGHLSALLCTDPSYLNEVGLGFEDILAAVPIAGGYDILHYYHDHVKDNGEEFAEKHVLAVFGPKEGLTAASPTNYIDNTVTPMLVVSETDTYTYTKIFEDAATEAGKGTIEFLHVTDKNHNQLYFSLRDDENSMPRETIIEYILGLGRR